MKFPKPFLSPIEILIGGLAFGILMAVVVPAARQAGEASELAKCRSNLYEIGQATYLYAADNDGRTPPNTHAGTLQNLVGTYVSGRTFGFLLAKRHGGWGPVDYIGRPQHLFCPSNDPRLWETYDYQNPDEIHAGYRISRMGYLFMYFAPGDRRSNASIYDDPHRPLTFDLGAGVDFWSAKFTLPSHSSVLNVLHVGGHVNTVSMDEANALDNSNVLFDWMTAESRGDPYEPIY